MVIVVQLNKVFCFVFFLYIGCAESLLQHTGVSCCRVQAQLLRGLRDFSLSGIKSVSPALDGGFLTTGPPGKSHYLVKLLKNTEWYSQAWVIFYILYKLYLHKTILKRGRKRGKVSQAALLLSRAQFV